MVQIAILLAMLTAYVPSLSPPGLQKRSIEYGAATAQVLVDSPSSALADLSRDTGPLATRALVYTQFMGSFAFREAIAKASDLEDKPIFTQGPFTQIGMRPNIARPSDTPSGPTERSYRLVFDAQEQLPVISVYAQAPTAREARQLANGAVTALRNYVRMLQANDGLPGRDRVLIRTLGPAEGGMVNAGASVKIMILTFLAVFLIGCAIIVGGTSMAKGLRESNETAELVRRQAAEADVGAGKLRPAKKRARAASGL